ncbi:sugar phosphate isomerase [Spirochaetia bacterium]|nr:sugar phosphate isomerase [Spirochaetia bacterium]
MKVGIQLYSVRQHMEKDPIGTINAVAREGYRFIEVANHHADTDSGVGFGAAAKDIKKALDDTGASVFSAHIQPMNLEIIGPVLDYHAVLGTRYIVSPMEFFKDRDEVLRKAELMNKVAKVCAGAGMNFLYHNHFHEFKTFDGKTIFDILLENTDPALVKIELDTYWALRGGTDPVSFLKKYGERVQLIHQKDFPAEYKDKLNLIDKVNREGITVDMNYFIGVVDQKTFTEIGSGIIQIQDIINTGNSVCKSAYIVLEQDYSRYDEYESIRISMRNFKKFQGIEW